MSAVKIQIIAGKDYTEANQVLVDNKLIYSFGHSGAVETERLRALFKEINELLDINVEITNERKA